MKKEYWIGIITFIIAMGLFSIFNQDKDVKEKDLPWYNLSSILDYIQSSLDSDGKLSEKGNTLPDEERRYKDEQLRWVAGGMDGAFGHHGGGGDTEKEAKKIASLVKAISQKDSLSKKVELYNLLMEDTLLDYIDPALEKIVASNISIDPYLHSYAKWLAFESPDRGPVKFGIALLGLIRDKNDMDEIITLGKHEEFTLYSAVALANTYEDPEIELWQLAKYVDGWGKIHIVERLGQTQNPDIKKWLIRDGYKNSILYEYLAYTCAVAGELKNELSQSEVDEKLISASGEIIQALITGGPAEDMDDYDDGSEVVRLYITHIKTRSDLDIGNFLILHSIKKYLDDEEVDWEGRKQKGWTDDLKLNLLADLNKILDDPKWKKIVLDKKYTTDDQEFWEVDQAAGILEIDLWDAHWNRLTKNPTDSGNWYNIMKNANNERIDQILLLAIDKIPLNEIATGPEDNLGIGLEYESHSCLDFILQDLNRYPNKGFELIKAGLSSPITRNRNMAINALSGWETDTWPDGTTEMLEQAERIEPDEDLKKRIRNLLDGAGSRGQNT